MMSLLSKVFMVIAVSSIGSAVFASGLYKGETLEPTSLHEVFEQVSPGTVVILSELHDNVLHHQNQVDFLGMLPEHFPNKTISVGMEFFYLGQQQSVDQYLTDALTEEEFLAEINWGGFSFDFYREQVRFPLLTNGTTLAINAPKEITRKISQQGIDSLTEAERTLIPPSFELGNEQYFERFREIMSGGGHEIPEQSMINYFTVQSLWDDSMAWTTSQYMANNPDAIFVIIVGDFHAAHGGGLPDRLKARGLDKVLTISQVDLTGLNEKERTELMGVHPAYGKRADYVWASESSDEGEDEGEYIRQKILQR